MGTFKFFAGLDDDNISKKGALLSLEEWMRLMHEAELHDPNFGRREAAFCFVWSQMFVTDEIKRREKMMNLTFEGFIEALARITCFKALPTSMEVVGRNCGSIAEFMSQLIGEGAYEQWCSNHAPEWW